MDRGKVLESSERQLSFKAYMYPTGFIRLKDVNVFGAFKQFSLAPECLCDGSQFTSRIKHHLSQIPCPERITSGAGTRWLLPVRAATINVTPTLLAQRDSDPT